MAKICSEAENFGKSYYQWLDTRRAQMGKLYLSRSVILYNGNRIQQPDIQNFFTNLPESKHTIHTLNAQPISPSTSQIILQISGVVESKEDDEKTENLFLQTLLLEHIEQAGKWKIICDTMRILEKQHTNMTKYETEKNPVIIAQEVPIKKIEKEKEAPERRLTISEIASGFDFPAQSTNYSMKEDSDVMDQATSIKTPERDPQPIQPDYYTQAGALNSVIDIYPTNMKMEQDYDE
jgi:hypothetical protein